MLFCAFVVMRGAMRSMRRAELLWDLQTQLGLVCLALALGLTGWSNCSCLNPRPPAGAVGGRSVVENAECPKRENEAQGKSAVSVAVKWREKWGA